MLEAAGEYLHVAHPTWRNLWLVDYGLDVQPEALDRNQS